MAKRRNTRLMRALKREMVYRAAQGANYSHEDAQKIGMELQRMEDEGLAITPDNLVERARPEDSPLHSFFEWNDTVAAEAYRKWQARNICNHLQIVTQTTLGQRVTKAVFNVIVTEDGEEEEVGRQYVGRFRVETEPLLRRQIFDEAVRQILYWSEKYETLGFGEFDQIYRLTAQWKK